MREQGMELAAQLVAIILYAVGAAVTGVVGLAFEYYSASYLLAGEYSLGAWVAFLGGVLLLFSFLFLTDKLIPSVRVLLQALDA